MSTATAWEAAEAAGEPNPIERIGSSILDRVLGKANARMVYGEPVQHGDRTVIPVARVKARFGFGGGTGRSNKGEGPESGTGGGGGGSVDGKPIGYIEISQYGTEFHEITDNTQIAMAGIRLATIAVVLILLRLLIFRRRKKKNDAAALSGGRRMGIVRRRPVVEVIPEQPQPVASRRLFRRAA